MAPKLSAQPSLPLVQRLSAPNAMNPLGTHSILCGSPSEHLTHLRATDRLICQRASSLRCHRVDSDAVLFGDQKLLRLSGNSFLPRSALGDNRGRPPFSCCYQRSEKKVTCTTVINFYHFLSFPLSDSMIDLLQPNVKFHCNISH